MRGYDIKEFSEAAVIRAVKTVAQAAVAGIGTAASMGEVRWTFVISTALLAGVVSILTSVSFGLPEVEPKLEEKEE